MEKEFKKLQKENNQLRNNIDKQIGNKSKIKEIQKFWRLINELIENEIELEKFCE